MSSAKKAAKTSKVPVSSRKRGETGKKDDARQQTSSRSAAKSATGSVARKSSAGQASRGKASAADTQRASAKSSSASAAARSTAAKSSAKSGGKPAGKTTVAARSGKSTKSSSTASKSSAIKPATAKSPAGSKGKTTKTSGTKPPVETKKVVDMKKAQIVEKVAEAGQPVDAAKTPEIRKTNDTGATRAGKQETKTAAPKAPASKAIDTTPAKSTEAVVAPRAREAAPAVAKAAEMKTPAASESIQVSKKTTEKAAVAAVAKPVVIVAEAKPAPQKPAVVKAKPASQKHGFKLSEHIVYPAHGVGQIIGVEVQEVAGFSLELFVVSFIKDKMILKVPTSKAPAVGMRKLAEADVVEKALNTLSGRARVKRTMWSRRAQEYEAKINSGDLVTISEVVRDLYRSDSQPEQSYSERQLYEAALDRMAREVAVVRKLIDSEALKLIESFLLKGPRRNAKADEAAEDAGDDSDVDRAA